MAKRNRLAISRGTLLLLGAALPLVAISVAANAQSGGGSTGQLALPGASLSASSVKAATSLPSQGPVVVPKDFSEYRVQPGDLLSVNIYETPEMSNSYRVNTAGELTLPLCGKVNLRGLTLAEAAERLEAALRDGQVLNQPQVNLDVVQYAGQYVTVLGEVNTPGRITVIAPTKLEEVIAQAGGVTQLAGAHVRIRRGGDEAAPEQEVAYSRSLNDRESASILVHPGDSIIVPRAGVVYVLGAVMRPGGYVMQEDGKLNVAEALALSGGTIMQANTGGLRVIRRNPDGTVLDFPLSYERIAKGTQTPLALQAQDIVYVPMSKIKATFSSTQSILGEAASAAIVSVR
jgi:polysaccharide export outer membrane protein